MPRPDPKATAQRVDCFEEAANTLIARVGVRVRRAREAANLPRRVISERSGVSPRYLAQLEAGEGNVSIGLLARVAGALGKPAEWFLSEEDPWTSDAMQVADRFRAAPADVRQRILATLDAAFSGDLRARRICLIGLRGAGKSTLGAAIGRRMGLPFVELNSEIEEQAGMPVTELMALYGPEGYRRIEAQAIDRIIERHDKLVLAVAGGIVAEPETYGRVLARFHTVWIKARPEEHMARVRSQGDTRPMAGNPEAMKQLMSILKSREAMYEGAHAQLDTSGRQLETSIDDLAELIRDRGFLGAPA